MRSLLCGLLSLAILVNSATPSVAQSLLGGGRAVSRAVANAERAVAQNTFRRLPTLLRGAGVTGARQTAALVARTQQLQAQTARQVTRLQQTLSRRVQYQQWLEHSTLASFSVNGSYTSAAQRILSLPSLEQAPLLRNEFVLLSLIEQTSVEQTGIAREFLRGDLEHKLTAFEAISGKSLEDVLSNPAAINELSACREALSDATALAFMGNAQEDASRLVSLYQAALNGPFEEVATRLTGRGLLRLEAYETFNEWAAPLKQEGEFWLGLTIYARKNHLPVSLHASISGEPTTGTDALIAWLEKGNLINGLNATGSLEATEKWMEIGAKESTPEAQATALAEETFAPAQTQVQPSLATLDNLVTPVQLQITPSVLPQEGLAPAEQTASATLTPANEQTTAVTRSSNSGILYGGIPLFPLVKGAEKTWSWIRRLWNKKEVARPAVYEEPGLHDNTVRPIYERSQTPMSLEADDIQALAEAPRNLEVAEGGFKLTVENLQGEENILHNVDITIDTSFETEGYNRIALRSDKIFELRNLTQPAGKMSHFFFELSNEHGELYQLASMVSALGLYRPMRIKLESKPNLRYNAVMLEVADFKTGENFNLQASIDKKLLPAGAANGKLLLTHDGNIYYAAETGERVLLKGYYIRLPKEESTTWMTVLKNNPDTHFNLKVLPTRNKTNLMTYIVSPLRIGTGKAFGPIMSSLGLSPFLATGIPLFANNGLTVLLGPLMPFLRRIGEANMYRIGVGLYSAASIGALSLGLNGFMGVENATATQVGGLVGVLLAMGFGGVLINTTQNNLVSRNAGAVQAVRSKQAKNWVGDPNAVPTLSYLGKRVKEVFTAKNVEMRDSVRYQWLGAFKNVGTFGFLALPFLFNLASDALGSSVRADFSLSFWPLAGLSSYALYKVLKMPIKDSVPRNTEVLSKMVLEAEHSLIPQLTSALEKPEVAVDFNAFAKQLNGVLTPHARALSYKLKKQQKDIAIELEGESLQRIKKGLLEKGLPQEQVETALQGLQEALDVLGHRNVSLWKVMKMPGVASALGAMTLLTVHEMGTASEFAYQVGKVAADKFNSTGTDTAALGMFLTALFLYGTSFFSRMAGNWVALRTREGSMYAFSSLTSVLGSSLLIASNGSLPLLFTGATLATFGMGNFFSQVFEYTIKQAPKFRPELAILIGYTMPVGAGLSACVHALAEWGVTQGIQELGLMTALGALVTSFVVCPRIFADSSLVRSAQYYSQKAWRVVKNVFTKKTPPTAPQDPAELIEAAAQ